MANTTKRGTSFLNVEVVVPTGGIQSEAAAIPPKCSPSLILAAGDGIRGIVLPPASKGMTFFISNTSTAGNGFGGGLLVYPAGGDIINALAANGALTMGPQTAAVFIAQNATQWYTFSFLPS